MNNDYITRNEYLQILKMLKDFLIVDEILIRKVSQTGNSGMISVPNKYVGKEAKVFILKSK